jgi:hypothetical protein
VVFYPGALAPITIEEIYGAGATLADIATVCPALHSGELAFTLAFSLILPLRSPSGQWVTNAESESVSAFTNVTTAAAIRVCHTSLPHQLDVISDTPATAATVIYGESVPTVGYVRVTADTAVRPF